jgi:hypothetical protein
MSGEKLTSIMKQASMTTWWIFHSSTCFRAADGPDIFADGTTLVFSCSVCGGTLRTALDEDEAQELLDLARDDIRLARYFKNITRRVVQ